MPAKKQKYRLDLNDIFRRAYSDKSAAVRSKLRPILNLSEVKLAYGREVIREIQKRTARGIDKNDNDFKGYSESYKKSVDFKIFGKSSSDVNLKLSGEMLAGMKVNNSLSGPSIEIFFPSSLQNAKADGHIRGTGKNNALPVRDFFGLPKESEEKILKKIVNSASRDRLTPGLDEILNRSTPGVRTTTSERVTISGSFLGENVGEGSGEL